MSCVISVIELYSSPLIKFESSIADCYGKQEAST